MAAIGMKDLASYTLRILQIDHGVDDTLLAYSADRNQAATEPRRYRPAACLTRVWTVVRSEKRDSITGIR